MGFQYLLGHSPCFFLSIILFVWFSASRHRPSLFQFLLRHSPCFYIYEFVGLLISPRDHEKISWWGRVWNLSTFFVMAQKTSTPKPPTEVNTPIPKKKQTIMPSPTAPKKTAAINANPKATNNIYKETQEEQWFK